MLRERIVDDIKRGIRNGEIPAHQFCRSHLKANIARYFSVLEPGDVYLLTDTTECEACQKSRAR